MISIRFKGFFGELEGDFYRADRNKVIIICHGSASNKDRERLIKASSVYNRNNFAVLRFNFGGSGKSYDSEISIEKQVEDLKAAIEFVVEQGYNEIGLQGESLGGLVCLRVYPYYEDFISTFVLWAPVTKARSVKESLEKSGFSMEEFYQREVFEKKKDGKVFIFPKKYFEERRNVDQAELLSRIDCPVLILHGDKDEDISLLDSEEAVDILGHGKLEVIRGLGHKFDNNEKVFEISLDWFKKYL